MNNSFQPISYILIQDTESKKRVCYNQIKNNRVAFKVSSDLENQVINIVNRQLWINIVNHLNTMI